MSSSSRPASPQASLSVPAQAPVHMHEASTSSSPVPPTPPPKDYTFHTPEQPGHKPPTAGNMAKLGTMAASPEVIPADLVIDISRPFSGIEIETDSVGEAEVEEADTTLRASMDAHGPPHVPKKEDVAEDLELDGETEADITAAHRLSDSPTEHEVGGSTLFGSGTGSQRERAGERGEEREHVQEHPLRLDVHPPSPPSWDMHDDAERGRISPQRYEFSTVKTRTVHEFTKQPRSHNRPLIPHSAYYFGPPPPESAYGTDPVGQIGVHLPREVVRIERDYTGGELPQFSSTYPLELEGRITPTQFLETINAINEILLSAHSLGQAFVDNALAFLSLQASRALKRSHYDKEMDRLKSVMDMLNEQVYNPVGLHLRWPRSVAFLFMEIEYY